MADFQDHEDDNPFLSTPIATSAARPAAWPGLEAPRDAGANVDSVPFMSASAWAGLSSAGLTRGEGLLEGASRGSPPSQRELERRERAVEERERAVATQENLVREALRGLKRHNWPRFMPLLYHSIEDDIPEANKRTVKMAYLAWILAATGYAFNWLTLTVAYFANAHKTSLSDWFIATLVGCIGLPASFVTWYMALYKAAQTEGGLIAYGRFFVHMSIHILLCLWMVLSLPKVGQFSAGIIRLLDWLAARGGSRINVTCAFFAVANIGLWSLCGLLSIAVLQQAAVRFRAGGGVSEMRRQSRLATAAGNIAARVV